MLMSSSVGTSTCSSVCSTDEPAQSTDLCMHSDECGICGDEAGASPSCGTRLSASLCVRFWVSLMRAHKNHLISVVHELWMRHKNKPFLWCT
jgi:hypothetical protein